MAFLVLVIKYILRKFEQLVTSVNKDLLNKPNLMKERVQKHVSLGAEIFKIFKVFKSNMKLTMEAF